VRIAAHDVHRPPGKALVGKGRNGPTASIIQTKFSDSSAILGLGLRTAPANQFFGRPNLF
jgi:hypothetical protein